MIILAEICPHDKGKASVQFFDTSTLAKEGVPQEFIDEIHNLHYSEPFIWLDEWMQKYPYLWERITWLEGRGPTPDAGKPLAVEKHIMFIEPNFEEWKMAEDGAMHKLSGRGPSAGEVIH